MAFGVILIAVSVFTFSKIAATIMEHNEQKEREKREKELELIRLQALVLEKDREIQKLKGG